METNTHIKRVDDDVFVSFATPVGWLRMNPGQAREFARLLVGVADDIDPQGKPN